jgi:hypothetical protein
VNADGIVLKGIATKKRPAGSCSACAGSFHCRESFPLLGVWLASVSPSWHGPALPLAVLVCPGRGWKRNGLAAASCSCSACVPISHQSGHHQIRPSPVHHPGRRAPNAKPLPRRPRPNAPAAAMPTRALLARRPVSFNSSVRWLVGPLHCTRSQVRARRASRNRNRRARRRCGRPRLVGWFSGARTYAHIIGSPRSSRPHGLSSRPAAGRRFRTFVFGQATTVVWCDLISTASSSPNIYIIPPRVRRFGESLLETRRCCFQQRTVAVRPSAQCKTQGGELDTMRAVRPSHRISNQIRIARVCVRTYVRSGAKMRASIANDALALLLPFGPHHTHRWSRTVRTYNREKDARTHARTHAKEIKPDGPPTWTGTGDRLRTPRPSSLRRATPVDRSPRPRSHPML